MANDLLATQKRGGGGGSGSLDAAALIALLLTVDGAGSLLDADLLDGQQGAWYQARANHTGTQFASTISDFDTQVRTSSLDQMTAPAATVSMNSQLLSDLLDPIAAQDGATKAYVDAVAMGLTWKESVRVATTAALPANTRTVNVLLADVNGALPSQDGVSLSLNDRILVKDEALGENNGYYYVTDLGDGSNPWELTRTTDMDTSGEVSTGMSCFVSEGSANGDHAFVMNSDGPITLNTTALNFVSMSSGSVDWGSPGALGSVTPNTGKFTTLTATGLTAGRVPYVGTAGLIQNTAQLLFSQASALASPVLQIGADTSTTAATLNINAAAGTTRSIILRSGGLARWEMLVDNASESGSDVGSAFMIRSFDDSGAYNNFIMSASREDNAPIYFNRPLSGTGLMLRTANVTSTPYTVLPQDHSLFVDHSVVGNITINLPPAGSNQNRILVVKNVVAGGNTIIDAAGSDTIEGGATALISRRLGCRIIQAIGTKWHIIGWYDSR